MVEMSSGSYILGGETNNFNSEFLPTGGPPVGTPPGEEWQEGFAIPSPGFAKGCAVAINDKQFVLIGGYPDGLSAVANVKMYDMETETWTDWSDLNTAVYYQGCAKLGDTIVVGGGYVNSDQGDNNDFYFQLIERGSPPLSMSDLCPSQQI